MCDVEKNLERLGIEIPESMPPVANYVPFTVTGNLLFISGQISGGKKEIKGRIGDDLDLEQGVEAARICAINILSQVSAAVNGDWGGVVRCIKLGGFVNSAPDFYDHPLVINGASDLMVEVLGEEKGRHTRFATGVSSLPLNFAVEIEAVFEIIPQ